MPRCWPVRPHPRQNGDESHQGLGDAQLLHGQEDYPARAARLAQSRQSPPPDRIQDGRTEWVGRLTAN
jgi:hypothetical protein